MRRNQLENNPGVGMNIRFLTLLMFLSANVASAGISSSTYTNCADALDAYDLLLEESRERALEIQSDRVYTTKREKLDEFEATLAKKVDAANYILGCYCKHDSWFNLEDGSQRGFYGGDRPLAKGCVGVPGTLQDPLYARNYFAENGYKRVETTEERPLPFEENRAGNRGR